MRNTLGFKRIIRGGILNFRRNGTVSLASVLVMTITLSVIAFIVLFQALLQSSLADLKNRVDISVYMTTDTPEEKVLSLKQSLEQLPEVGSVEYVSRDKALEDFRIRHANDYVTLQALSELNGNPLGAILNVRAKDSGQYESIARFLESENDAMAQYTGSVERINYSQNKDIIDRLNVIIDGGKKLGFAVTLILALVSVLITYNTIRLAIYTSREEIGVMRLVGAENKYIRGPFIVEGLLSGVIGTFITILAFIPLTIWAGSNLSDFLGVNLFSYYISNIFQIFFIILIAGAIISAISSVWAVRKYLTK
ncbi:MAG: permease-like cell division protein FtsX [bacterium]